MPAPPAPPGARRQRRRESRDWVTPGPGTRKPPPLPRRSRPWLRSTREWWACVWRSPVASAWIDADLGRLHRLAWLVDAATRGELPPSAHAQITALEDRYGLSPKARRSLQWLVAAPTPAEQPRTPSSANVRRLRAVDPSGSDA